MVDIAGIAPTWTPANFIDTTVAGIRERVDAHARQTGSDGLVICALSGGVDSAVAAALVHRAVGDRLTCIYVDHGLMRKKESELLRSPSNATRDEPRDGRRPRALPRPPGRRRGPRGEAPDHRRRVHQRLRGGGDKPRPDRLPDPGHALPRRHRSGDVGDKAAQKIKTHHNVGGLPADLGFKLIEPLRYLFKDEVRRVGLELGLPEAMVLRQPFPGPGLAIRILGEVTAERLDTLREADWIVIDEIKAAGLYRSMWQTFAVLTPVRSVGVMGDGRTYDNVVAIRAVTSEDGMTADWASCRTTCWARSRRGSSTRSRASTASSTTSARSRRRRSNGNEGPDPTRDGWVIERGRRKVAFAPWPTNPPRRTSRPASICPWCSAASSRAPNCASCGANLTSDEDDDARGDRRSTRRVPRPKKPPTRNRLLSWISGE